MLVCLTILSLQSTPGDTHRFSIARSSLLSPRSPLSRARHFDGTTTGWLIKVPIHSIAYESNESGQDEIYVRPFPDVDGGKWQVSQSGGSNPIWSKDTNGERELFFLDAEGYLSAAEVGIEGDGRFTANRPKRILERRFAIFNPGKPYDVSPDGERFLMIQDSAENAATEIHVVLNWLDEFQTLAARRD